MHSLPDNHAYAMSPPHLHYPPSTLVLSRGRLARLELVQVPSADGQAALVLVHALAEVIDVSRTRARRLLHLCRGLVLLGEVGVLGRGFGGRGRAAAEPAADGVADGGADCDTAARALVGGSWCRVG